MRGAASSRRFTTPLLGGSYTASTGITVSGHLFVPNMLLAEGNENIQLGIMFSVGYMIAQ